MTSDATRFLDPDPFVQFERWWREARSTWGLPMPEAMTLSTTTPEGRPASRTVLLKGFDRRGFVFFTNYESRKARHLDAHPFAALALHWQGCLWWTRARVRQVLIEGRAERVSDEESRAYFATRPRGSRIGAWASPQSQPILDRAALEAKVAEVEQRFAGGEVPCPPFWGGYRVVPDRLELWMGRVSRLHDRFCYTRTGEGEWRLERLAP